MGSSNSSLTQERHSRSYLLGVNAYGHFLFMVVSLLSILRLWLSAKNFAAAPCDSPTFS